MQIRTLSFTVSKVCFMTIIHFSEAIKLHATGLNANNFSINYLTQM